MSLVHVVFVDGILQIASLNQTFSMSPISTHAKIFRIYFVIRQENVDGLAAVGLSDGARVLQITTNQNMCCSLRLQILATILIMFL